MIKQALYIFLLFPVFYLRAQTTAPTDTIKAEIKKTDPVITQTVQPVSTPAIPSQTNQTKPHKPKNLKQSFEKENKEIAALYKEVFARKKEIVLQNKRYRIYNNYLTAGAGKCYNSSWRELQLCTAFDFNFHIAKKYFQIGGNLVSEQLWDNNCIQLHAGWGYRYERCNYQLAAFGGLSFSDGYYLHRTDTLFYKVRMNTIGVYAALQAFYKLKFDYGIGLSAFFDANAKQTLTGIKIEIFFSGAYKGLKKINYAKEDEKYQTP